MSSWNSLALLGTSSSTLTVSNSLQIYFLGIPVKYFPEDSEKMPAVQYAALIADLVVKTKQTLGYISNQKDEKAT